MIDDQTEAEKRARISELDRQIAIRQISLETGVPPEFLQNAHTAEQIEQYAQDALAWRGETPAPQPRSQTNAPQYNGVGQLSRDALTQLPADVQMAAYRAGRLAALGAPAPPERQDGAHH